MAVASPFGFYEYVDVTFTTANQDVDVVYGELRPEFPEDVRFIVVDVDKGGVVYRDRTASRKKWQAGLLFLRCSAANTTARILLYLEANT